MLHVITSNPVRVRNFSDYVDNFVLCHGTRKLIPPRTEPLEVLKIYHQDGMDLDEYDDYLDDVSMELEFIPVQSIPKALDLMAEDIANQEKQSRIQSEEDREQPEEFMVAVACDYGWNARATDFLTRAIRKRGQETVPINVYRLLHVPSMGKLATLVKGQLGSDYVYPEDPIAFGYALGRVLDGTT